MSALLTLDSVSIAAPDGRLLFSDLTLSLSRDRVGLVGRNGSGKSTLLRTIGEGTRPHAGTVAVGGRTGFLRQIPADPEGSAAALMGVAEAFARLERVQQGAGTAEDFDRADWLLPDRVEAALVEVRMRGADLTRPLASFSGGERMRIALAGLLLEEPELILLDEPTNDLDRDGRDAVIELVRGWRGAALIASHDRELLEHVDRIVELSPVRIFHFGGSWSGFAAARDEERERAQDAAEQAEARLRSTAQQVQAARERQTRRDGGGRAYAKSGSAPRIAMGLAKRRAEATAGRIVSEGTDMLEADQDVLRAAQQQVERITPLTIDLPSPELAASRVLVTLENAVLDRGGGPLFPPLDLVLRGPERVALTGRNGAGKSSLMKLIAGEIEPASGMIARNARIAWLDQHVSIVDPVLTILDNLRRCQPELTDNQAYAALARFAFRNRDALKCAGTLSGGERLRVGLACTMSTAQPPELLMLDEPTNHLDLQSIEILEQALRGFGGAILLVSHDATFRERVGITRTIALG